jgi:hypothetical protein
VLSEKWAVGAMGCRNNGPSEQWAVGIMGCRNNDLTPVHRHGQLYTHNRKFNKFSKADAFLCVNLTVIIFTYNDIVI